MNGNTQLKMINYIFPKLNKHIQYLQHCNIFIEIGGKIAMFFSTETNVPANKQGWISIYIYKWIYCNPVLVEKQSTEKQTNPKQQDCSSTQDDWLNHDTPIL